MKTNLFTIALMAISLGVLLQLQSCKKCKDPGNPECENYDPYYGKHKPTAEFTIRQSMRAFGWADKPENTPEFSDTIVASEAGVLFTANEGNAKYEWTIGDDLRVFTTKEVALDFTNLLKTPSNLNKPIPIILKVTKIPPLPYDQGDSISTIKRFLVFRPEFLWNGTFEGSFENEIGNTRQIRIDGVNLIEWLVPPGTYVDNPTNWMKVEGLGFYGFPQVDTFKVKLTGVLDDVNTLPNFRSYKQWHWKLSDGQKNPWPGIQAVTTGLMSFHAYSEFSEDGKYPIKIKYSYRKTFGGTEEHHTFTGTKIP